MKKLVLILMCLSSLAQAAAVTGTTLLIEKRKQSLLIPRQEQLALDKELGEAKRNQLYLDIVMQKSVAELSYEYQNANRPITKRVIQRYGTILLGGKQANVN